MGNQVLKVFLWALEAKHGILGGLSPLENCPFSNLFKSQDFPHPVTVFVNHKGWKKLYKNSLSSGEVKHVNTYRVTRVLETKPEQNALRTNSKNEDLDF